jgi:RNA polymerase sigma-70 factor (ECF subfamily)
MAPTRRAWYSAKPCHRRDAGGRLALRSGRRVPRDEQMSAPSPPPHHVTSLLQAWSGGDEEALHQLIPVVYDELSRVARRYMAGERASHTLQTTALIHEVYLRLVDIPGATIHNRAHFFAICARLMRNILVDFARSRQYQKRGGGAAHVVLDEALHVSAMPDPDLEAIDDALQRLETFDRRKSQVVELRFFGGLTVEETAEALNISPETVMRDWKLAKVWLLRELDPNGAHGG